MKVALNKAIKTRNCAKNSSSKCTLFTVLCIRQATKRRLSSASNGKDVKKHGPNLLVASIISVTREPPLNIVSGRGRERSANVSALMNETVTQQKEEEENYIGRTQNVN
jgi:hypothetical protein